MINPWFESLARVLGIDKRSPRTLEKLVSALGGLVGILAISLVTSTFLSPAETVLMVASMGATAVLLFAVPHGPLSQPWPVFGGHLVSALVGVSLAKLLPGSLLAGPLAVGLAIGLMQLLHAVHPPGGATALTAVIGGQAIQNLGYSFVVTPVLLNVLVILSAAVVFNNLFAWRRYPLAFHRPPKVPSPPSGAPSPYPPIAHEDLVYALSHIDGYIDVSEQDLLQIYELATQGHAAARLGHDAIMPGFYYSNGRFGQEWEVREVIRLHPEAGGSSRVDYLVVAGPGAPVTGSSGLEDFALWVAYRVEPQGGVWRRARSAFDRSGAGQSGAQ